MSAGLGWMLAALSAGAAAPGKARRPVPASCQIGLVEGELNAGAGFSQPIGNGLRIWFQPIAAGWILRVVPVSGPLGEHDYAELATPPYDSVTPLSLSTDFAFRAQDAVGWNPRRFRFATSPAEFARLSDDYQRLVGTGGRSSPEVEAQISRDIARSAEAKLTIVDARLAGGTADQWKMAAAVSERFTQTAHTLVDAANGRQTPLGKLLWLRFRVEWELPPGFRRDPALSVVPHPCGSL